MTGNGMAGAIVTALEALPANANLTTAQMATLTNSWDAIAGAIVAYIQSNAGISVPTLTGLQAPAGTAGGPVTGSGSTWSID
jgi:hypothetical protein